MSTLLVVALLASVLTVATSTVVRPRAAQAAEGQIVELPLLYPTDINGFDHVLGNKTGSPGVWKWDGFGDPTQVPGMTSAEEIVDSGAILGRTSSGDYVISALGTTSPLDEGDYDYVFGVQMNRYMNSIGTGVATNGDTTDVDPVRWFGPSSSISVMNNLASAFALNGNSEVFGSVEDGTNEDGSKKYAWVILADGAPQAVSGLPASFQPVAMNDRRQVAGYRWGDGCQNGCAGRWDNGTMVQLGSGMPRDLNEKGYVVGERYDPVTFAATPVVWDPEGMAHPLSELIPAGSAWTRLTTVSAINDDCDIVGMGFRQQGETEVYRGYKLTLPECSDGEFEVSMTLPSFSVGVGEPLTFSVTYSNRGHQPVTGFTLLDDVGLSFPEDEVELVSGPTPAPPGTLPAKSSITLEYEIAGKVPGTPLITAGASGVRGGEPVEDSTQDHLIVIPDLVTEIVVEPADIDLSDGEGGTEPKDVTVKVKVTNQLETENVYDVDIEVRPIMTVDAEGNPAVYEEDPFTFLVPDPENGGMRPGYPENETIEELPPGASEEVEFPAQALTDGFVKLRIVATGRAGLTRDDTGPVGGADEHVLPIGRDVLLYFEANAEGVDERSEDNDWVVGGHHWSVVGQVENRSNTETIRVLLSPQIVGNGSYAVPIPLGEEAPDPECAIGIVRELAPNEEIEFSAPVYTLPSGGTRVTVTYAPKVEVWDDEGAPEVEPRWVPVGDERVLVQDGAREHLVHVDVSEPAPDSGNLIDHVYWFSVGTVQGLNTFVEGITSLVSMAARAVGLGLQPWLWDDAYRAAGDKVAEYLSTVYENLPEADKQAWRESIWSTVALATGQSLVDVRDQVDQAVLDRFAQLTTAYETGDSLEVARWFGELAGENIDLVAQAATFGACKLASKSARYFDKGLRAAEARLAVGLEARAASGARALKSGDLLDYPKLRNIFGVDEVSHRLMQDLAEKWNIIIAIRRRGVGVLEKLKTGRYRLKMEAIKAKNVGEIDVEFLGFSPSRADEVVIKQPPPLSEVQAKLTNADPELRAQVLERWKTRWNEWYGKGADPETGLGGDPKKWERGTWGGYEEKGIPVPRNSLNPVDNIEAGFSIPADATVHVKRPTRLVEEIGTDGRPQLVIQVEDPIKGWQGVTGDIDPMAFLRADGTEIPPEARLKLYEALRHLGFQHPESMTWTNKAGRDEYFREFNHLDPTTEAMAAYHPDGRVLATRFDPGKGYVHPSPPVGPGAKMAATQVYLKGATSQLVAADAKPVDMAGFAPPDATTYYVSPKTVILVAPGCPGAAPQRSTIQAAVGPPAGVCPISFSTDPDALVLREGADGLERWTGAEWVAFVYELGGAPVEVQPQTSTSASTTAGSTAVPINEMADVDAVPGIDDWFQIGQTIVINPGGENEETVKVTGFGSLLLDRPLRFDHAAGELVTVLETPATPTDPTGPTGPTAPADPQAPPAAGDRSVEPAAGPAGAGSATAPAGRSGPLPATGADALAAAWGALLLLALGIGLRQRGRVLRRHRGGR